MLAIRRSRDNALTYVLNLVLVEIGNAVDNDPGKRAAKVDEFVHQKGHDTSGEHIVANVRIPGHPQLLEIVEVYIVLGYLLELVPVCVGGVRESVFKNSCRVAVDKSDSVSLKSTKLSTKGAWLTGTT